MVKLALEILWSAAGLVTAVAAIWQKLRAERYRGRWRNALKVNAAAEAGQWEVRLDRDGDRGRGSWVVTNGAAIAARLDADFQYDFLAERARKTAETLAKDLNAGKVKVA